MSTICQLAPLDAGRTNTNDSTLAVCAMGARHHGTIPCRKTSTKVPSGRDRLLHQMGRDKTTNDDNREKHPKFCLEGGNMPIWDTTSTCL